MKIHCSKTVLVNALSALSRIIPTRAAHPILSGFMIFTRDDTLVLQATDLELSLTITVPAEVEREGCVVVTGRHITELIRRLPDGALTLMLLEDTQQLEVLYGKASVRINTWAVADFPVLPSLPSQNKIALEGARWKNMLKKITIAAASQEVRPNYAGVYIQLQSGRLKLVATDTYRLAFLSLPYQEEISDFTLFVPVRPLGEVSRLLDDDQQLEILWDQATIGFQTEEFTMTARLMDAQFPAYEKVIPKEYRLRIRVNKELLNDALERAVLFNELPSQQAVVDLKIEEGILYIAAEAAQVGSIREEIPLAGVEGESCEALFTTRYLLDPLKILDRDEVSLCLNGPREPAVYLEDGDEYYLHLILPVRRLIDGAGGAGA
jgi:DNA polymerase-3 subunit beta